jgi:hypothetical protein
MFVFVLVLLIKGQIPVGSANLKDEPILSQPLLSFRCISIRVFLIKIEKSGFALIYKPLSHLLYALLWLLRQFNAVLTLQSSSLIKKRTAFLEPIRNYTKCSSLMPETRFSRRPESVKTNKGFWYKGHCGFY